MKNRNYKIGDLFICKKDFYNLFSILIYKKGEIYNVEDVASDYMRFLIKIHSSKIENNNSLYFSVEKNKHFHYVNDYFYTMKEARRLKLKKLNSPLTKIVNLFKQK